MDEWPKDLVAIPVFPSDIVAAQCKQERARLAPILLRAREETAERMREKGYTESPRFEFEIYGCEETQRQLSAELGIQFADTGGLCVKYVLNPTGMDDAVYAWARVGDQGKSGVKYAITLVY